MSSEPGQLHNTLRKAAMDHLARREHTFDELLAKLEAKYTGADREQDILPVLEQLRAENLQNDERFAEAFVRSRRERGHGPLKIKMELARKGLAASLINDYLYHEENDWRAEAGRALEKKFGTRQPGSPKDFQRFYRFLAQRGFGSEEIRAAIDADP